MIAVVKERWPLLVAAVGTAIAIAAAAAEPTPPAEQARIALPTYTPATPSASVAKVAVRDAREVATRSALLNNPERVDLAVTLARGDIQRSRALSDPRYLGRAQAELARWYDLPDPPPDVLLLRATIRQSLHDFIGSRADLDHLLERRPDDPQAQLTRAVVSTITSDFPAARASCAAVAQLASPMIAATCVAPIDGIQGHADDAYARLSAAIDADPTADPSLRGWSITALAELAEMRGDYAKATDLFRQVLALDGNDAYARAGLADLLILAGKPAEASTLLAGRESIDNLLVRRAIAEHLARGADEAKVVRAMQDRIAAAAERGDRIHMREEAMFVLRVEGDAVRAVQIAKDDFAVQKEMADARLLASCAVAAHDAAGLDTVRAWRAAAGVKDAQLDDILRGAP
nr:tetratricopeptide repeat protein [Kofleriaceae bacterium]